MRIGIISTMTVAPWGGSEALWAAMAREALADGHAVTMSLCAWPETPPAVTDLVRGGARVAHRPRRRSRVDRALDRVRSPFREWSRATPDVVCISQGWAYDFLATPGLVELCRRIERPIVVVCHGVPDESFLPGHARALALEFFARARPVLFVSERSLAAVERHLARRLDDARVVRNPVDVGGPLPVAWPADAPVRFACVARLDSGKGQDILLEVLGGAAWRERPWRMSFYGAGPDREYLEALGRHQGIADRLDFGGHVADVRAIWATHHAPLLASRAEGMPVATVEAMLCGRAPIVTDVGGHTEWLEDGGTGFIAEAATVRSFGATLERAWSARASWPAMGRRAFEEASKRIDPRAGRTLLEILVDAARGGPSSR